MWGGGWGWLFILFIIVFAIPWGGRRRVIRPEEQILRERYARGEITRDEFEQRMRDLRRAA
ncbi:MAG TPA: SHOCT domain-containing protein [Bryobacteraceae bacterium]|nr:SHOCT domain-containing protein [Bryobacteraceae bacterium]